MTADLHYRSGQPLATLLETFERDVLPGDAGCWLWTGPFGKSNGYGRLHWRGQRYYAHRVSYELLVAPIPAGLVIDHLCRVRLCVNPEHLEPVTNEENVARAVNRDHIPACKRGHPTTPENTYVSPKGHRMCYPCQRVRYQMKKAAA